MAIQGNVHRVARSVKKQIKSILRKLEGDTRAQQLRDEVHFWREWFATCGKEWPDDYLSRFDPNYPLQSHVSCFAERLQGDVVNILDIGAGPLTSLGKIHPNKKIAITATDLLASEYDNLLEDFGINPLVRTVFADADNLQNTFQGKKFEIVHAQNSIDHTTNPMHVIQQMISVTKEGGFVVLLHAENEGLNEGYQQLHKWDFAYENGDFIISGPGPHGQKINASHILSERGRVECERYHGYGGGGTNLPSIETSVLVSIQKF